jgi:L-aminopeptidase/D-esterase-like protein
VITDVGGVRVGHWTDSAGRTGCTVVLFPEGTVGSGEIRGGAPGTRETGLLDPSRTVTRVDAFVLSGGSAFGLAACDGVMRWCEERGVGLPTPAGPVPIVVGAVLYDLGVGDPRARPDAAAGYTACVDAVAGPFATGPVGAGCGATVRKWQGPDLSRAGGLGTATVRRGELVVSALVVVNAVGDVRPPGEDPLDLGELAGEWATPAFAAVNTTLGVVVTNAALDKTGCHLLAQSGHDGLARALDPAHTTGDGDFLLAAACGAAVDVPVDIVRVLGARVVEAAARRGVELTGGAVS